MKVLTAYIRQHRRILIFYFGAMAVFFVLLFFYRIPVAGWAYGAALCLVFGLVLGVPDYFVFRRKHQELKRLETGESPDEDLLKTLQMVALTLNGMKEESQHAEIRKCF